VSRHVLVQFDLAYSEQIHAAYNMTNNGDLQLSEINLIGNDQITDVGKSYAESELAVSQSIVPGST